MIRVLFNPLLPLGMLLCSWFQKKDGSWRPVIDYSKLNAVTVSDHYPLPVLRDLLQSLGDHNTVFSSLDLLAGYWQVPLAPESRPLSAFSTPSGHFEYLRLPFGL